jgi:threonyl-tRNA synthetase
MIHRAIFGSLERFFGIMVENYAGDFPFWLAPEQIRLLPVTDEVRDYANRVRDRLEAEGVRACVDRSGDRLGKLIRNGEQMKIPVLAVIGAREAEQGLVALRSRRDGDLGAVPLETLLQAAGQASRERQAGLHVPVHSASANEAG